MDAPPAVASFLQRLGRSGRRAGTQRNCLFLATSEESLLRILGLLELWSSGYVEPVIPPQKPYPILTQQVMALCLQETGIGRHTWSEWLRGVFHTAQLSAAGCEQMVEHMLQCGYLFEDQGILSIGGAGERTYGKRNYMQLFSVFDSPPLFKVVHGRTELGSVHQSTFQVKLDKPISLSLGGHSWRVKHVDWKRRQVFVEPGNEPGKSRWFSAGQPLAYEHCQAILRVLAGSVSDVALSNRAVSKREAVLSEYEWVDTESTSIVSDDKGTSWWTFGGGVLNSAIAAELGDGCGSVQYDNFAIDFRGKGLSEHVAERIRALLQEGPEITPPVSDEVREEYRFGECVPDLLLDEMIALRFSCVEQWNELKLRRVNIVHRH